MRTRSRARLLVRLLPLLLSGYELRAVLGGLHVSSLARFAGAGSGAPGVVLTLALLAGAMALLRESGRNLLRHVPRPRWSPGFFAAWLVGAVAALEFCSCLDVWRGGVALHHAAHAGSLPSLAIALLIGFLIAVAAQLGQAALRAVVAGCTPRLHAVAGSVVGFIRPLAAGGAWRAPVADGWSSRGPPPALSAA